MGVAVSVACRPIDRYLQYCACLQRPQRRRPTGWLAAAVANWSVRCIKAVQPHSRMPRAVNTQ
jgi:hypothetical protein